ncbi:MAG: hypothetical protein AB7N61_01460 [Acidimicrobiia bacterium]
MDGVLSDAAGRQHFLDDSKPTKDWKAFFEACGDDPIADDVHKLLDLLDPTLHIVLLTARPARVLRETLAWLERYEVRWDALLMRDDRDHRTSSAFKHDSLAALREHGFEVLLAFEDDRRNVAMFRENGVHCVYIHSGYYE